MKFRKGYYLLIALLTSTGSVAQTLCPDGSYVGGSSCSMTPDGTFVGGEPHMAPDGSYVGNAGDDG